MALQVLFVWFFFWGGEGGGIGGSFFFGCAEGEGGQAGHSLLRIFELNLYSLVSQSKVGKW